jgi:2,5-dihydroxypyridine 5,6-dioxygenase
MKRRSFIKRLGMQSAALSLVPAMSRCGGSVGIERADTPGREKLGSLVEIFTEELKLCNVKPGEKVLYYTIPSHPYPEYQEAALAAARSLGAETWSLLGATRSADDPIAKEAFKAADLVLGTTSIYSDAHNEALASGTRTLSCTQPPNQLVRRFPTADLIKRTYAGTRRLAKANEIRVTDDRGTDFTMRKDGRNGHAQVGISERPGRWDNFPSGLVTCAPLEDGTNGTYILHPGDIIYGLRLYVKDAVRMDFEEGRIVNLEGGRSAQIMRDRLERFVGVKDPVDPERMSDPFRVAHAGWGTEKAAEWHVMGMDAESLYGNVMVSLGRNMFASPDEFTGLGGKNYTPVHVDLCCRNKNLYLDGELIVDNETIVPSDLA